MHFVLNFLNFRQNFIEIFFLTKMFIFLKIFSIFFFTVVVVRTCSKLSFDQCNTLNGEHFCYCDRNLCNGENAESIIEKFGDVVEDRDDDSDQDGSGSDEVEDLDYNYRTTSRKIDFFETSTTDGNKFAILSVSPVTQPTTSEAVSFHSSRNHLIFLLIVCFFFVSRQNWKMESGQLRMKSDLKDLGVCRCYRKATIKNQTINALYNFWCSMINCLKKRIHWKLSQLSDKNKLQVFLSEKFDAKHS